MLAALIVLGLVWLAPQDAFVAQRAAAAARNPGSPRFTIAFPGERRTFRPGEPILVVLSYDDVDGEDPYHFAELAQSGPIQVFSDPVAGVAAPLIDYERALIYEPPGICCGVRGGVVGGDRIIGYRWDGTQAVPILAPPPPKPPPITGTLVLNQLLRFDAAGRYRIYITDGHSGEIADSMGWPRPPPLVSNMLELEITGRDRAWEERTAADAIAVLSSSHEAKARTAAARTLRFLGTDRAIDEMVRRLSRVPESKASREDSSEYVRGFFAARDRERAIVRLEAALDDGRQPASWLHLVTLAALRLAASEPPGAFNPAHKRAAYNVLAARRQRALHKAGILTDGLAAAFGDYTPVREGTVRRPRRGAPAPLSPSIAEFPREVEIALGRMARSAQRAVLERGRDNFTDRRLVPLLTRLAGAAGTDGPAAPALSILNDSAPSVARRIILADLARSRPRFGIATTGVLPDRTLPAFDARFLAQLTAARGRDESSRAMERIARYASAAIAPRLERVYRRLAQRPTCRVAIPALSYFFRTDPAFATKRMQEFRTWMEAHDSRCSHWAPSDLLSLIAVAGMSPALEDAAITAVAGPDQEVAAGAARMLAALGSPRAEGALWAALESRHARWASQQSRLDDALSTDASWNDFLDDQLQVALRGAVAWRLDERDSARLISLCLTPECKESVERWQEGIVPPTVSYDFDTMPGQRPVYRVDFIAVPVERLREKFGQYPPGTTFRWSAGYHWMSREWLDDFEAPLGHAERLLPAGMQLSRK
jgi:hypothetical protein